MPNDSLTTQIPPPFLKWADEEVARLHVKAHREDDRQVRFRIENEVATIEAAATLFRRWLKANGYSEVSV